MENIVIELVGTQKIGDMFDKTELDTIGTLEELDDRYIVRYTEQTEPSEKPADIALTVFKDESYVEMARNGGTARLVIEKSKRNLCCYGTDYGNILMGISGHIIEAKAGANEGKFDFSYDIDFNGALASRNKIKIKYKIKRENDNVTNS